MKPLLALLLITSSILVNAQNGYIKFSKHQKVEGYVSIHKSEKANEHQVEIKLDKNDTIPKRYHKRDIHEYAINSDTFRILKKFYPYDIEAVYYELIDAKVLVSGKVSLLQVHNSYTNLDKGMFSAYHGASPSQVPYFYVLEDEENDYHQAVPSRKEKFRGAVAEFFNEEVIAEYEKLHGTLHYKDIEKFVRFGSARVTVTD
jgi:hypothetical protein